MKTPSIEESREIKLYGDYAKEGLERLSYPSEIIDFGAADEAMQRAADPEAIIEVRADNMIEHREPIDQVPDIALRVEGGWLAGSDRGEWGGELVYIPDGQKAIYILKENIEDIYKLADRYVVTAGLAHIGMNDGDVYELIRAGNNWAAKPWRALPGAPQTSWFVETGELLVNTYGGGSVLISKDGSMRMAECL